MKRFKAIVTTMALVFVTFMPWSINTAPAQAKEADMVFAARKDPCFFTNAELNQWENENNGNPGWNDTLAHIESISGCVGTWDATNTPKNCTQDGDHMRTFRVWAQSDGDQVWIAFADYYPNNPRFKAHCEAGIVRGHTFLSNYYVTQ